MFKLNEKVFTIIFLFTFSTKGELNQKQEHLDFLDGIDLNAVSEALKKHDPDAYLSVPQLIDKYGYNVEIHQAVTADKYILEMHRITGPKNDSSTKRKPAVFLMHGLFMSSADWIILGPGRALGYLLADAGYDVWMGNSRGNTYCRKHIIYPITTKEFWNFSWNEMGKYDLPVMIDKVLKETGNKNITYIGHSQGTTSFFVMASSFPEYNKKILSMHALAPVAFCRHIISPPFRFLSHIVNEIQLVMHFFGRYEVTLSKEFYRKFTSKLCAENSLLQPVCSNILFLLAGFDAKQLNMTLLPTILGHAPAGASIFQLMHYAQMIKKDHFRQFDYGVVGNWKKYKRLTPPEYDLSLITTRTIFYYTYNDWLAHTKDVDKTYNKLGNPTAKIRVPLKEFNHLDFIWGKDAKELLYDKVLSFISRYEKM